MELAGRGGGGGGGEFGARVKRPDVGRGNEARRREREKTSVRIESEEGDFRIGIGGGGDGYYVAYKLITLSCILFMLIEMKFIYCYSCVMFAMKSMSMCND